MTADTVLVEGRPATAEELSVAALTNYGHFTTMQVRDRAVRGLDRHLDRLARQQAELFTTGLDLGRVRELMRAAVADRPDAQLRVTVVGPEESVPTVLVSLRPPSAPDAGRVSLLPVDYVRPAAHLKHVGGFGQSYFGREARRRGFDDALLVTPDGLVAETTVANIAFLDDGRIVWPDAPVLHGTAWQLLDAQLATVGLEPARLPVRLDDVRSYVGAFVANSTGLVPVDRIGEHVYGDTSDLVAELDIYLQSTPWDLI